MKILVLNSGSSSIKFKLFEDELPLLEGSCDSIGLKHSKIRYSLKGNEREKEAMLKDHRTALNEVMGILRKNFQINEICCVAHRVVHGGEKFKKATIVDKEVVAELEKLSLLAPLHNPPNIKGIKLVTKLLPTAKNVAVFDTAYHSTIPQKAYLYGLPYELYEKHKIRRFGFHGTSHKYVTQQALKMLGKKKAKIISCHLGNGSSLTASLNGKSVDTSMGFTPLEGMVMGTRSGSIDPAALPFLMKCKKIGIEQAVELLNKKSGLLGLSGISPDMRILIENYDKRKSAKIAVDVFCYVALKYVGSYAASLDGVDAIVFTGGIGENSWFVRKKILDKLGFLGLKTSEAKNKANKLEITAKGSKVRVFVIKTNEELQMVREAIKLIR